MTNVEQVATDHDSGDYFGSYVGWLMTAAAGFGITGVATAILPEGYEPSPDAPLTVHSVIALAGPLIFLLGVIGAYRAVRKARLWIATSLRDGRTLSRDRDRFYRRTWGLLFWCGAAASALPAFLTWLVASLVADGPALRGLEIAMRGVSAAGFATMLGAGGIDGAWLLRRSKRDTGGSDKVRELAALIREIHEARVQMDEHRAQAQQHLEELERYRRLRDMERDAAVVLVEMRSELKRNSRSALLWNVALLLAGFILGVFGNAYTSEIIGFLAHLLP